MGDIVPQAHPDAKTGNAVLAADNVDFGYGSDWWIPGSTLVPSVGFGIPPKRTSQLGRI